MKIIKQLLCNHEWMFGIQPTFKDEWRNISSHYICKKCKKGSWQSYTNDTLWSKVKDTSE